MSVRTNRANRIRTLQEAKDHILESEDTSVWIDPIKRRQLLMTFSKKWGLRIQTVHEYTEYLD